MLMNRGLSSLRVKRGPVLDIPFLLPFPEPGTTGQLQDNTGKNNSRYCGNDVTSPVHANTSSSIIFKFCILLTPHQEAITTGNHAPHPLSTSTQPSL